MEEGDIKRYEFDAPCHVVDLKEFASTENDDEWFEHHSGATDGHLITPCRPDQPFVKGDEPGAAVIRQAETDAHSGPTTSPPANIVTSWGAETHAQNDGRPARTANQPPAQPRRVSKRKEMTSGPAAPPLKKHKGSPVARKSRSVRLNSRTAHEAHPATTSSTTTEPSTSEEQELERIRNLQKEVALHRKRNEASYKAALAGNVQPKKMVLPTTVPKDFHFSTDTRAKESASSSTSHKVVDFVHQLRKPSSPAKARRGATVPKPFNLSTGNKRKTGESDVYVPMAQQVEQFQKRTPTRYHLRSRRSQERGPPREKANHLKLTQPHSPHLATQQRSRPPTVKSSADLEAEEVEKLQKFKLKALELNKKILESADDLKKPVVKEPTVPECFELEIEKRLQGRQATKKPQEEEEQPHNFRAKPLPKKVLEGVVGLPEKKVAYPTVPESPAFALKKRVRLDPKVPEVKQISPIKPPPVPHFGLPFQPRLPEHHHVEVCPFSFEQREQERRALKEKKLEEKRNEEVPQFKAQPLPHFDTVVLPEKKKLEPTKPEPFRLLIDERGAVKNSRWEHMVKEEQKHQEEATIFKARPNTVTRKEPFRPKKEDRGVVVVEAFELATERRAREWQEYEQLASEKEAVRARMEAEQRREEEQKEKEEINRMRKEQVHKAQPIRHYKPVAVKKSEIPLTVPESPNFSDRFRL
ncbi:targeting protein for Xklp2 isoform X2 [Stegastes partitus]|uniref:Targeting protein for Xklp2 isoform X2 n=1 Tax=Stegastes partitus TaxID=144197 RepID=A0A9Y4KIC5_9TELE|nr:PREDICTED: targeting protein for Xklp2 isoform X2 [Stegastes partitus]